MPSLYALGVAKTCTVTPERVALPETVAQSTSGSWHGVCTVVPKRGEPVTFPAAVDVSTDDTRRQLVVGPSNAHVAGGGGALPRRQGVVATFKHLGVRPTGERSHLMTVVALPVSGAAFGAFRFLYSSVRSPASPAGNASFVDRGARING